MSYTYSIYTLPQVCAWCGSKNQIEKMPIAEWHLTILGHSESKISMSICPECKQKVNNCTLAGRNGLIIGGVTGTVIAGILLNIVGFFDPTLFDLQTTLILSVLIGFVLGFPLGGLIGKQIGIANSKKNGNIPLNGWGKTTKYNNDFIFYFRNRDFSEAFRAENPQKRIYFLS